MGNQKIRIRLWGYEHSLLDRTCEKILETVSPTGARVKGPIPLPTEEEKFTVLKSPHVNTRAREQFEIRKHKRLLDLINVNQNTVEVLMKLELSRGVEIEIKV